MNSQDERASRYRSQLGRFFRENNILGAHWFRWQDHITESEQMNKGLVYVENGHIRTYEALAKAITQSNLKIKNQIK